jgi:hypothetical protein
MEFPVSTRPQRFLFCPIPDFQVLQSAKRTIIRYQNGFDSQRVSRDHHIQIPMGIPPLSSAARKSA